jgi:hypothetical protein
MPYYVQKSGKKSWRIKFQEGKSVSRNVPKLSHEAKIVGFRQEWSFDEARSHAIALQARDWVKEEARRQNVSKAILERYKRYRSAFLSDENAEEFEQTYLSEYKIKRAHWNTMQKIIVGVELHPSEWFEKKSKLYAQFKRLRFSPNYARKLLRYLNLWGYFLCKKEGKAWMKVPGLDGVWVNRLEDGRKPGGPSKPLSPSLLTSKAKEIPTISYNWLYLSVWFGLRPEEVDQLRKPNEKLWRLTKDEEFTWVLSVFQTKLHKRGVPIENCWKHLPCVFNEQVRGIEIIRSGEFKKPVGEGGKFMTVTFGTGFSYYAGRNNFSGLLRDAGYDLETRKHWLGHLSISTTEAYDRKTMKNKVFYRSPRKAA